MSIEYTTSNAIYTSGTLNYNDSDGTTTLTYPCDNSTITVPWYNCWPKYYYHWCGSGHYTPKFEKAFKIVQMLMDEKIVKLTSVKKFVALVNKVSEVI